MKLGVFGAASFLLLAACHGERSVGVEAPPQSPSVPAPPVTPEQEQVENKAPSPAADSPIEAAVAASDRTEADRALDPQRRPSELLEFFGVQPGQRVAELAAGGGYTTELLARVVGPSGKVYGQNSPFILDRFAEKPWSERLQKPVMSNVMRIDSEFDEPLPPEVNDLDGVYVVLFYHDTVWFKTDRQKMNEAVFSALRPGGVYGIVDHAAAPGAGFSQAKSLHRIEQSALQREIEEAGFVLEAEADFLRNSEDTLDWSASPSTAGGRRGTSDRFVLRFVKPREASSKTSSKGRVVCEGPRGQMCPQNYAPVCAELDTGVRCVRSPCPSTKTKTFGNGCMACANPDVMSYTEGPCSEQQ